MRKNFGLKKSLVVVLCCAFTVIFSGFQGDIRAEETSKFKGQTLTVLIWGSGWDDSVKYVASQFEKKYGCTLRHIGQSSAAEGLMKVQAMKGKPSIDMWFTIPGVVERARPGLLADIDYSLITEKEDLVPGTLQKKWVGWYYYPYGIVYREDLVPRPITRWEDLWDSDFKGKIAIPAPTFYQAAFLIVAAYLNGGSEYNIDPGFEKIKEIMPNTVTIFSSDATARHLLAQGEVAALIGQGGYYGFLLDRGIPAKLVCPKPTPLKFDVMTVIKGGNEELAHVWIDYLVKAMPQEKTVVPWKCMPVNKNVPPAEEFVGTTPEMEDMVTFDQVEINKNLSSWVERWNREIIK